MRPHVLFGVALLGVASVAACSGGSASRPDFLPPLRRFEGLQAQATRNAAGRTCVTVRLGTSELSNGCQPEGQPHQSVVNVGGGNFRTVEDRAPGGTDFSAFALDFDDIVYRFEDSTDSGTIATSGLGYLLVLTPGISQNADWRIWLDSGDGQKLVCRPDFAVLSCGPDK